MVGRLIERYKQYRKQQYLNLPERYPAPLAFVGVGGHSISNLYPVLQYLGAPLKYIVTRNPDNARGMARRFPGTTPTSDLEAVLADDEVQGVLVCAAPSAHFSLAKKVLEAGKGLWVEKPICQTAEELAQLQSLSQNTEAPVVVGLQKRYATVYTHLEKAAKEGAGSYQLSYLTGAYPEGAMLAELFIHPLDWLVGLFGPAEQTQVMRQNTGGGSSYLIQARHRSGHMGQAELSTAYQWNHAREHFLLNTPKATYEAEGLDRLTRYKKEGVLAGVPLEKVFKRGIRAEVLYENSGFVPVSEFNPVFAHGYYGAVRNFLEQLNGHGEAPKTGLNAIAPTYQWMQSIESQLTK